jgi:HK97 family phage major capsid protein
MALDTKNTLDDVRAAILAKRQAAQPTIPAQTPEVVAQRNGEIVQLARSTYRGGPLKAFRGENGLADAYKMGQWLRAALLRDEDAIQFCRDKGILLKRQQTGTDDSKGGIFVPVEFDNTIIDLRILYGIFRKNANVSPMTSDTKIVRRRVGGLTAYPVGAGKRGTQSTALWDSLELIARKWMVLAKFEEEVNDDSVINFADTLASEIAYAFTKAEDEAGFLGDGTSTYHGIVGLLTKIAAATAGLKTASGNAWSEITEADMLGVIGKLPQFARQSGLVKWYCSEEFNANVLQRIMLAKGGVTYAEIAGELVPVFMGKPVEIVEVMPHTEANSQIPVVYGNLSQAATMGDRRGVQVKMTDSNDTDFESDVISVKGTERFDINVHDVGDETNAGAVVGLKMASS